MANAIKKFKPLFDRVLIQKFAAEVKSKGGLYLPEKAQGKVLEGTVIATGPGARGQDGKFIPTAVNVGDKVFLPEYGGTKITVDEEEYFLFKDHDILGKFGS